MNKRKVAEYAEQNKKGKAMFIPCRLLEMLWVLMLDLKVQYDHLSDTQKETILVESWFQMTNKLNCTW